jgi:hypothetical protein
MLVLLLLLLFVLVDVRVDELMLLLLLLMELELVGGVVMNDVPEADGSTFNNDVALPRRLICAIIWFRSSHSCVENDAPFTVFPSSSIIYNRQFLQRVMICHSVSHAIGYLTKSLSEIIVNPCLVSSIRHIDMSRVSTDALYDDSDESSKSSGQRHHPLIVLYPQVPAATLLKMSFFF